MTVILPILSFIIFFLLIHNYRHDWRQSLITTCLFWGVLLTFITEYLNLFKVIYFNYVLEFWILSFLILAGIYVRFNFHDFNSFKSITLEDKNKNSFHESLIFILLIGICLIAIAVGLIAIIAPPNNWDSMDYHMSRVAYWIQNHSIAHYPTSYTPQLYQNPWSEFAILHFQILNGGDYFANLVQWLSLINCVIGVSLIAKQLGANLQCQVLSAVVTATIPMGILQASSTQNDYVLAFWLVCLAYYTLLTIQPGKTEIWINSLQVGSSIGLALLTKGTAYFYVFPYLVWLAFSQIKRLRWQVWKPALIVGTISLLLNINHYLRNYHLFASPLGEPSGYTNEVFGINILFSNILRNLALHIGTPIGLWNGIANKLIQIIHKLISVDVNDPRITFTKTFFVPGGWSTIGILGNENSAGNFLHLLLIILCIIIFIYRQYIWKKTYVSAYLIAVLSTFILFCYLVKWQPWNSRLHLPFFVLISPFTGIVLGRFNKYKIASIIAMILIFSSLPWVFMNKYRPIITDNNIFQTSRIEQYFNNRPYLKVTYIGAVEFLNSQKCLNIGLSMGNDPWEYPLWVLWQQNKHEMVKIQHINVKNVSAALEKEYPYKEFEPCGIIAMETKKSKQEKQQEIIFQDKTYIRAWNSPELGVFLKN